MKVFISHSRENSSAALKLSEALEKRGFQTWIDVRDLAVGVDSRAVIGQAIKGSDAWLFLIGPGESDRGQKFEFQELAGMEVELDPSRAIIPVVVGSPDDIPGFLTIRQFIHVEPHSMDFEAIADKAAQALRKPEETIDQQKLQRGREAREREKEAARQFFLSLAEPELKRSDLK